MAKVNLYIEDTEIKLLVTSGNRVDKWASLVLDEGLVDQGLIMEPDKVSEAIKKLFDLQSVGKGAVTLGISGLNSIFRIISIPEVGKGLIPEAVANEAARVLPVPLTQVYHAYQVLPSTPGELRIFLAAYPRQATDVLISTVVKAGLKPHVMELAPLAIARCVNLPRAIVVNSWLTFLDIAVMVERVPQVIRSVSLPVDSKVFEDRLPSIIEEINRTITFYNASNQGAGLDKSVPLVVSGDLAREEKNWKPLGRLGYPVQPFKPAMEYKPAFDPTHYSVNCGLALKGLSQAGEANYSLIDFNALPASYQPTPFSLKRVLMPVGMVALAGGLAFGYLTISNVEARTQRLTEDRAVLLQEITQQKVKNDALKASIKSEEAAALVFPPQAAALEKQIAVVEGRSVFFTGLMDSYSEVMTDGNLDINEIVDLAPAGINLESVSNGAEGYTVAGKSTSEALVLEYGRALEKGKRFSLVLINSMTAEQDTVTGKVVIDFKMTVK